MRVTYEEGGEMAYSKLKVLLLKRGVKQADLAQACGWDDAKLSRFATGRKVPGEEEILVMAEALQMGVEKLRKECGW
jgi:transcriptional regulator with XRE-family HTH domain